MIVIPFIAAPALGLKYGVALTLGFVAGCAIAIFNFYWLKRSVAFLSDRVLSTGTKQSGARIVTGFIFRYLLIGAGAYVIFKSSANSVYGLFAGLFLPVGAILVEAVYETWAALRRGF